LAHLVDWPIWPDALPEPLLQASGGRRGAIERFHSYDLGGFIDHDWLWRIDARPEVLEAIAQELVLSKAVGAPPGFWDMPPYYWPGSCRRVHSCIPRRDFPVAQEISTSCSWMPSVDWR
jgi:hypothetical protein